MEKKTQLASIEMLFPSRAIHAAWHTYVTEDGEVVFGPSIHRKAFPNEDISEILPEIAEFVSADYVQLIAENAQQVQQIAQLQAALAEHQTRIADLDLIVAQRDARIAELENALAQQQAGAD